jgi:hypothetical protein
VTNFESPINSSRLVGWLTRWSATIGLSKLTARANSIPLEVIHVDTEDFHKIDCPNIITGQSDFAGDVTADRTGPYTQSAGQFILSNTKLPTAPNNRMGPVCDQFDVLIFHD